MLPEKIYSSQEPVDVEGCYQDGKAINVDTSASSSSELKLVQAGQGLQGVRINSTGSFGSWVEVSEVGSRPAVLVQIGLFSEIPSDSLLEGLQALLPGGGFATADSRRHSLTSACYDGTEVEGEGVTASSFNEESFVRVAEADLAW